MGKSAFIALPRRLRGKTVVEARHSMCSPTFSLLIAEARCYAKTALARGLFMQ
jgi:hypothetical protein